MWGLLKSKIHIPSKSKCSTQLQNFYLLILTQCLASLLCSQVTHIVALWSVMLMESKALSMMLQGQLILENTHHLPHKSPNMETVSAPQSLHWLSPVTSSLRFFPTAVVFQILLKIPWTPCEFFISSPLSIFRAPCTSNIISSLINFCSITYYSLPYDARL